MCSPLKNYRLSQAATASTLIAMGFIFITLLSLFSYCPSLVLLGQGYTFLRSRVYVSR